MKKPFSRIVGFMLSVLMTLAFFPGIPLSAEDSESMPEGYTVIAPQAPINRDETLPVYVPEEPSYLYSFPDYMKGVFVVPGVDFALTGEEDIPLTDEEITADVEVLLDKVASHGLNTIIVKTTTEDVSGKKVFYSTDINETVEKSAIEYIIAPAKARGMFVYLDFEIDTLLSNLSGLTIEDRINTFAIDIRNFTVNYPCDGIVFSGYYASKDGISLNDYLAGGSGIGFDNWLLDNNSYIFSLASAAVRKTDNTIPVGIALEDVWENYESPADSGETDETDGENDTDGETTDISLGSETSADFEALTDGYADTLSYIKSGFADFMLVVTDGSITDPDKPFKTVTSWWGDVASVAQIPMYISHANEKICTDNEGWYSPDELVKQVIAAEEIESCKGSVFNSLYALEDNEMESTTALEMHYSNSLDVEGLDSELEMTLPTSTNYKTEEPYAIFAGSFDPNFPVYYQGSKIVLNEAGRFYYNIPLEVGLNVFTFQSKAKVITYKITRTVNVLKEMSPSEGPLYLDGETTLSISAVGYKGSKISASVNGKSVELTETDGQTEGLDPNSSYARFQGYYTVPKGKIGEEIDLGNVEIYGSYTAPNGTEFTAGLTGAQIIINAVPEQAQAFDGSLLRVKSDNTMTYRSSTTSTNPTPDASRLPAGTLDYYVKTVTLDGVEYYITNSGRRIKSTAVDVLPNEPLGANPIGISSAGTRGTDTFITFTLLKNIPYNVSYNGADYQSGDNGSYYVKNFKATSVSIIFDYVTSVSAGDINFPETSEFTVGKFDTYESAGLKKTRLTLYLRENGVYCGISGSYDSTGNLTLNFNGAQNSISGATIVIDPGHGYTEADAFDPGAIGHIKEQTANLAIAKYLEAYLKDAGANVIRLHTESERFVTKERAAIARNYDPDIFISVHCNSAGSKAFGTEAYYFTPFSEPLARYVSANIAKVLNDVNGAVDNDRGAKYNYFFVTQQQEFPSILVETAFVTNYAEAMSLADDSYQRRYAKAIMSGIEQFFNRTTYSSYGDGYASF
ncbi:MAG: N-acetylmuramoyl-L-alanine amidase [Ruminococcus sp.]|jgi:N-acetylmuramoyl-L-alanine amidase|nr:N-acetylmuramoyl-L-alanine amidase [Ruminococcus sp.]